MDRQELKEYILRETKNDFPYNDREQIADLLFSVMEYDIDDANLKGLQSRFDKAFQIQPNDFRTSLISSIHILEPLCQKLLFILRKQDYDALKGDGNAGLGKFLDELGISRKLNAKDVGERCLAEIYDLRNLEFHQCADWTDVECHVKTVKTYAACLWVIKYKKGKLLEFFNQSALQQYLPYAESIKKEYQKTAAQIILLNAEENMNLHIASKQGGRRGTVLSLMKNEIEENRMILWGVAGAGKTTTLRYLAYEDAADFVKNDGAGKLPVIVSLGLTTNESKSVKDYIKAELDVDDDALENLLNMGALNLYFDGFNEIPYTELQILKKKRRMELTEMIRDYPNTFMIFTDRPEDGEEFQSVPVFDLLPMDDAQIEEFINKHIPDEEGRQLLRETIEKDKNLKELVKRPFILSMLIAIAPHMKNIPMREGLIIGEFLRQLFRREKHEKYDENLDEKKMTLLLRRIGYESFEKSKTNSGMSEEEIIAIMNQCQQDYKFDYKNLYALKTFVHLGILDKRGDSYVFAHQRYQDYYNSLELTALFGEEL